MCATSFVDSLYTVSQTSLATPSILSTTIAKAIYYQYLQMIQLKLIIQYPAKAETIERILTHPSKTYALICEAQIVKISSMNIRFV